MLPIEDERLKRRIVDEILAIELADNTKASTLEPDGTFSRVKAKGDKVRAQVELIKCAHKRAGTGKKKKKKDKEQKKKHKRGE
jgi:polyphosphate kinase